MLIWQTSEEVFHFLWVCIFCVPITNFEESEDLWILISLEKYLVTALGATPEKLMKVTAVWKYRLHSEISLLPTDTQHHISFMETLKSVWVAVIAGSQPYYCFSVIQVISAAFMIISAWWSHKKTPNGHAFLTSASQFSISMYSWGYNPIIKLQLFSVIHWFKKNINFLASL